VVVMGVLWNWDGDTGWWLCECWDWGLCGNGIVMLEGDWVYVEMGL
jgi:hypothetical protein